MRRLIPLLSFALFLLPATAWAQCNSGNLPACPSPLLNTATATALKAGAGTVFVVGTATNNPVVLGGLNAGAALNLSTAQYETAFGHNALQFDVTSIGENEAFGWYACNLLTTAVHTTCLGHHAGALETTQSNEVHVGTDSGRNSTQVGATTAVGESAARNGGNSGLAMANTAIGITAQYANAGSLLIGGTVTPGDVISLVLTSSASAPFAVTGSPITVSYTVQGGDTTATIATALAAALVANTNMANLKPVALIAATDTYNTSLVGLDFAGTSLVGNAISIAYTQGANTETVTIGGGFSGYDNIAIGDKAEYWNGATTAHDDIGIGRSSLFDLVSAINTTAVGNYTGLYMATGDNNTFFGYGAGQGAVAASTGSSNTFLGAFSGNSYTTANSDLFGGFKAGFAVTTAAGSVLLGWQAGVGVTTGTGTVAVGAAACSAITTVSSNICIGEDAGLNVTTANNTLTGTFAGLNLSTGSTNTFYGYESGEGDAGGFTGSSNAFFGGLTGIAATTAQQDVFVGYQAGTAATSASLATVVGYQAGKALTSASGLTALGAAACGAVTTGNNSTCIGSNAGAAVTGNQNVIIGANAVTAAGSAATATVVGYNAGHSMTGAGNTLLGTNVGSSSLTSGTGNVLIGNSTNTDTASSNTLMIGGASATQALTCTALNGTPLCTHPGGSLTLGVSATTGGTLVLEGSSSGAVTLTGGTTGILTTAAPVTFSGMVSAAGNADVCTVSSTGVLSYNTTACGVSSMRFKLPVGALDGGALMPAFMALTPAEFRYKPDMGFDRDEHDGLYAEQVCALDERLCGREADGQVHNYDPRGMLSVLVAIVQKQEREIEALKKHEAAR